MEFGKYRISYLAEQFANELLENYFQEPSKHISDENVLAPYDIEVAGLKIDVKYSAPTTVSFKRKSKVWDFSLKGKEPVCDFYCLVGSLHGIFDSVFLIETFLSPKHHIRISVDGNSKWKQFRIYPE